MINLRVDIKHQGLLDEAELGELPEGRLGGGLTVKNARDSAVSRMKRGNILERTFGKKLDGAVQIYGNESAKIQVRGLR